MRRLIAVMLTATFLIAIVATPCYKINTPTLNIGSSVTGNKNINRGITIQ